MPGRLLTGLAATLTAALLAASPAVASLAGEVSAGQAVAGRLQAGTATCQALSGTQFEHLGEYVMDRMVGSRAAHEAMNRRMAQAIGSENTDRMHELLGRRYAGCAAGAVSGVPMGPGMMGYAWMRNGAWRHMSSADWRGVAGAMMGASSVTPHHGWSTAALLGSMLAALLLGALLVLVARRRQSRPPAPPRAA